MTNPFLFARITDALYQPARQTMSVVKSPQRQQAGITGNLAPRKINSNGSVSVEGKGQL